MYNQLRVSPINKVEDIEQVASDLHELIKQTSNDDLFRDFPNTRLIYSDSEKSSLDALKSEIENHHTGIHEVYVASIGSLAVGLSVISRQNSNINGIDPSWPNLSSFICNPYRGIGLGRLALETRLNSVRANFGGKAWTRVHVDNDPSLHLLEEAGFTPLATDDDHSADFNILVYVS